MYSSMKHFFTHAAREIQKNSFDYLILLSGGILFLLSLRLYQGNRMYSFVSVAAFCVLYILWGVHHHFKLRNLHLKNIVEYILIGFTFLYLVKIILVI
ncbi:MAG: hypothetical protein WC489_01750 [Patescibacteria group bacterium]